MTILSGFARFSALACLLSLAACSGGPSGSKAEGQASIGKYDINWQEVSNQKVSKPTDGLTHLFFTFSWSAKHNLNGVTEADYEAEAARTGVTVYALKNAVFRPGYTYKTREGRLASCTIAAIDKGLCGNPLDLSVAKRAEMARSALDASNRCNWVGFDKDFNAAHSYRFGAASHSLHVLADCG